MSTMTRICPPSDRKAGPPLIVPAVALAALTAAGGVLGSSGPRPDWAPEEVLAYTAAHGTTMAVGAALLLGSAFPLVVYAAATMVRRMRRLGVTAPGPLMGLAGAVLAAASIGVSALVGWTAAQTAVLGDAGLAKALATLWFATGGIGSSHRSGCCCLASPCPS